MELEKAMKIIAVQAEKIYDLEKRAEEAEQSRDYWAKEAVRKAEKIAAERTAKEEADQKHTPLTAALLTTMSIKSGVNNV